MDQCEDREEEVPTPKASRCGEHESQRKAQRGTPEPGPELQADPGIVLYNVHPTYKLGRLKSPTLENQHEPQLNCVSFNSDQSMLRPFSFNQSVSSEQQVDLQSSEFPDGPSAQQHKIQLDSIFMLLEDNIVTFVKNELKKCQKLLDPDYPESQRVDEEVLEGEDAEQRRSSRESFMKIIVSFLRRMKQEELADHLLRRRVAEECQHHLKRGLKDKFQCVFEGIDKAGNPMLPNQIYTELYITEGGTGEVKDEHEVRQIETAFRKPVIPETTIRQEDIFKLPPGRDEPIRTVMTKGVAGIGKTVLTQKFTLDWAEDKANQDIHFLFPFTFRELNVLKEKKFSLVELVHHFFTETKDIWSFEEFQVVFIFDGLDECRLPLDFHKNEILTDVTESTSVDVLLTNLIRGNLLPSARLWITTRPAAANQIPPECVGMVTEVRGFTDPQKEEYFRRRFRDEEQASRIISHIKTSRSLHIMCHIPVFCWITATVLEDVMKTREGGELPKTLTEMYVHFLVVQTKVKKVKYDGGAETDPHWSPESRKMIESLGKLAFDQLEKGNLIFYESDLTECGIDIRAASVYSGVFTQIFREERGGLYQDKVFCFVHLSVQEFLAALHVHLTFVTNGVNLMDEDRTFKSGFWDIKDLHQSALDKASRSPNGEFDLFLRFLLALSLQQNQIILCGLVTHAESSSQSTDETICCIKRKIKDNVSTERILNLFHCLNELKYRPLVEDIQQYLNSGRLGTNEPTPAQWSDLVSIILSSESDLDAFDLKKYRCSTPGLLIMLPLVKVAKIALLNDRDLLTKTWKDLFPVLCSKSSRLQELDLSNNNLEDSGLKLLFDGFENLNGKLKILRLNICNLSEKSCEGLSSVVSMQNSHLQELDLSNNKLRDSGVQLLCNGLGSPHCALKTLRVSLCYLSGQSCRALSSILSSRGSHLRKLDLSNNDLLDSGVKLLCSGLEPPHCKLECLSLSGCLITEEGCASLASALSSNPSHLRELDLSYNHPGDSGVKLLSAGLKDPHWRLDTLRMEPAGVRWLTPGLRKYFCQPTINASALNRNLKLSSDNRKLTQIKGEPEQNDSVKLLCDNALSGRCYWEVEWSGHVSVCLCSSKFLEERDAPSWSVGCCETGTYFSSFDGKPFSFSFSECSVAAHTVAVFVDVPAGVLSFYGLDADSLVHIHTYNTTFNEPFFPGFQFWFTNYPFSSIKTKEPLC